MMRRYLAEFLGTMILVLLGVGAAVVAGQAIGVLGIAFAFGLAFIAMAYSIGPVSGCHINPAVSIGFFTAGRLSARDLIKYVAAQTLGGIVAALILLAIVKGQLAGYNLAVDGLGQNGWGVGFAEEYSIVSAMIFEFVGTLLFVRVILMVTQNSSYEKAFAGLAIGLTLTAIHIVGINITGTSVNPARSLGPAIFVGGRAIEQLWLFLIVPLLAGIVAGLLSRPETELISQVERPDDFRIQPQ
jgi:aquaporin Z